MGELLAEGSVIAPRGLLINNFVKDGRHTTTSSLLALPAICGVCLVEALLLLLLLDL
jgi:hypothetical protein